MANNMPPGSLAAIEVTAALGNAIRDLGEVPSGHLYARVCDKISLETYKGAIDLLKRSGLVKESSNLLTWIGPKN